MHKILVFEKINTDYYVLSLLDESELNRVKSPSCSSTSLSNRKHLEQTHFHQAKTKRPTAALQNTAFGLEILNF